MTSFVDIHCHALCGVDDGAATVQEMCEMLRMAYEDGTRKICLTPHYDSISDEVNEALIQENFALAQAYCCEHLPEMTVFMGNELSYRVGCVDALINGNCRTMANSQYVLVDFFLASSADDIRRGVLALANSGYIPIVAHVERYECLRGKIREIVGLAEDGALLQMNAGSLQYGWLSPSGRLVRKLLSERLIDIVASDGHNAVTRQPYLSGAYASICSKYGEEYAEFLFSINPERVLLGERIR